MTDESTRPQRPHEHLDRAEWAIAHVVHCLSVKEVADRFGVHRTTVHRYLTSEAGSREVSVARAAVMSGVYNRLVQSTAHMLRQLEDVAENGEDERARVEAARTVLDRTLPIGQANDHTPVVMITAPEVEARSLEEERAELESIRRRRFHVAKEEAEDDDAEDDDANE